MQANSLPRPTLVAILQLPRLRHQGDQCFLPPLLDHEAPVRDPDDEGANHLKAWTIVQSVKLRTYVHRHNSKVGRTDNIK